MSKYPYIRLTFAVHAVIKLFPEGERLKQDIQELADEILVNLICSNYKACSDKIKTLNGLFDLAKSRGWVDARNFLVLQREYQKIAEFAEKKGINSGKTVENSFSNKKRKEIILDIIKENGRVKVGDLVKSFPAVNRRTLLRDLDGFCQVGLVKKNGNGRGVCYVIKNATL